MSFEKKYLKYKRKYLSLIELSRNKISQNGGAPQPGEKVNVIKNNGVEDGMTNQCFWISIKDFIIRSGINRQMTLRQLRTEAGLTDDTKNTKFDNFNPVFEAAINTIAKRYKLQINVWSMNSDGKVEKLYTKINPNGPNIKPNIVQIASYGDHFELIFRKGTLYEPAVNNRGTFIPITNFDQPVQNEIKTLITAIINANERKKYVKEGNKNADTTVPDNQISQMEINLDSLLQLASAPAPVSAPVSAPVRPALVRPALVRPVSAPVSAPVRPASVDTLVSPSPSIPSDSTDKYAYLSKIPWRPECGVVVPTDKYAYLEKIPMRPQRNFVLHGGNITENELDINQNGGAWTDEQCKIFIGKNNIGSKIDFLNWVERNIDFTNDTHRTTALNAAECVQKKWPSFPSVITNIAERVRTSRNLGSSSSHVPGSAPAPGSTPAPRFAPAPRSVFASDSPRGPYIAPVPTHAPTYYPRSGSDGVNENIRALMGVKEALEKELIQNNQLLTFLINSGDHTNAAIVKEKIKQLEEDINYNYAQQVSFM